MILITWLVFCITIGIHPEMSSKSDIAIMSSWQIRTLKLVHNQAEFLLLVIFTELGFVLIFVLMSYVYTAMQRKLAIGTHETSKGTLTPETAKIYRNISGILLLIQTQAFLLSSTCGQWCLEEVQLCGECAVHIRSCDPEKFENTSLEEQCCYWKNRVDTTTSTSVVWVNNVCSEFSNFRKSHILNQRIKWYNFVVKLMV